MPISYVPRSGSFALPAPIATGPAAYAAQVLADTPSLYWKCQEASGQLQDSSGFGRPSTAVGSITYQNAGPMGDFAIIVPGGSVVSRPVVGSATNNLSYELFFKWELDVNPPNTNLALYNGNSGADGSGIVYTSPGLKQIEALCGGVAAEALSFQGLTLGNWYHIVVVRDAGTWKYYINGSLDTANAGTATPNTPTGSLQINTGSATQIWVAHAAYYESVLSPSRIAAHWAASGR